MEFFNRSSVFGRAIFQSGFPVLGSIAYGSLALLASAADPSSDQLAFFEGKVRLLLVKHCYECHSTDAKKVKGGLLLDSKAGWMAGGDSGDVLEPGIQITPLTADTGKSKVRAARAKVNAKHSKAFKKLAE